MSGEHAGRAIGGIAYTSVAQAVKVTLGFMSTVLLTRLLAPEDFGLVAMVMPVVALAMLAQDFGLSQVTIQAERIENSEVSTLFWIGLLVSVLLAGGIAASASFVAQFYGEPRAMPLLLAFSGLVVVWGVSSQPVALLTRHMRFKALAAIDIGAALAGFAVGIAIAYVWRTYWALFAAALCVAFTTAAGSWIASRFRPTRPQGSGTLKRQLQFGGSVSGFNFMNFFARNLDAVLIGRVHGPAALGLYERAYKLLLFPLQQVTIPLARVMVPLLSRRQSDPEAYRRGYFDCVGALLLLVHPGVLTAIVFAPAAFAVVLGPQWVEAAPIFQWLGLAGLHQAATQTAGWLFLSQARGRDYLVLGALGSAITVGAIVVGLPGGPLGVATAYAISELALKVPLILAIAGRSGPVRTRHLIASFGPHLIALLVAAGALFAADAQLSVIGIEALVALTILSYLAYGATLLVFPAKRRLLAELFGRARAALARRGSSARAIPERTTTRPHRRS